MEGYQRGYEEGVAAAAGDAAVAARTKVSKAIELLTAADTVDLNSIGIAKTLPKASGFPKPPPQVKPVTQKPAPRIDAKDGFVPVEPPRPPGWRSGSVTDRTNGHADGVPPAGQRILDGLRELEVIGVSETPRVLAAFMAGYSHLNSKGFVNAIGALRSGGLVDYPTTGVVSLTDHGRASAQAPSAPLSTKDIQDRIVRILGGASGRILAPLIDIYPEYMLREELLATAGYGHANSKGFVNAIGRLKTLGFVDYPSRGIVRASELLFPGR